MEVEQAFRDLGRYSRWQLEKSTLISVTCYMSIAFHSFIIVFIGWTPPHQCRHALYDNITDANTSLTSNKDGSTAREQCYISSYPSNNVSSNIATKFPTNQTVSCNVFSYNNEGYESLVTEYDLVCENSHVTAFSQSMFYFGILAGSALFPNVADLFGRKPTIIVCMCLCGLTTLLTVAVTSPTQFIVTRFFVGLFMQGGAISINIINSELYPAGQRSFAMCYLFLWWTVWLTSLTLVGYLITSWRLIMVYGGLCSFLALFGIWIVEESIPWLVANGKGRQAVKILQLAAKRNKVNFKVNTLEELMAASDRARTSGEDEDDDEDTIKQMFVKERVQRSCGRACRRIREKLSCRSSETDVVSGDDSNVGILKVFRHANLRFWSVLVILLWMITNILYYGMTLSSVSFSGNRFLNFFLSAIVEFPAYLSTIFLTEKIGRRLTVWLTYTLTGVFLIANIAVPQTADGMDLVPLKMALFAISKFWITAAYGALYIVTVELYPTNFRSRGIGISSMFARFGAMLSPFCEVLARKSNLLLGLILGSLAIMNGIFALALPETKGQPIPQTLNDIDKLSKYTLVHSYKQWRRRSNKKAAVTENGDEVASTVPLQTLEKSEV